MSKVGKFLAGVVTGAAAAGAAYVAYKNKDKIKETVDSYKSNLEYAEDDEDSIFEDEDFAADCDMADTTGDGNVDTVGVDSNEDGRYDEVFQDTTGDGKFDTEYVDTTGDGIVDTVIDLTDK